jgi:hypothetical protein
MVRHYDRIFDYKGASEFDFFEFAKKEKEEFSFNVPVNIKIGYNF